MQIFLGSSREALSSLYEVATWLEDDGHEPKPWNEPGLILPGESTFTALVGIARTVDAAIFIFGEDDTVWYRKDSGLKQPRDNVLVEYGLFSGILGQRRVIVCREGEAKLASDVDGIVYVDLNSKIRARLAVLAWARLTSTSVDDDSMPAMVERVLLKRELEETRTQLAFEELKSRDLQKLLTDTKVLDFTRYDGPEGLLKLLFDREFVWGLTACFGRYFPDPVAWQEYLVARNLQALVKRMTWDQPANLSMTRTYIAKVLRLIRRMRPDSGLQLLQFLLDENAQPDGLDTEVKRLVQTRVQALRAGASEEDEAPGG